MQKENWWFNQKVYLKITNSQRTLNWHLPFQKLKWNLSASTMKHHIIWTKPMSLSKSITIIGIN